MMQGIFIIFILVVLDVTEYFLFFYTDRIGWYCVFFYIFHTGGTNIFCIFILNVLGAPEYFWYINSGCTGWS